MGGGSPRPWFREFDSVPQLVDRGADQTTLTNVRRIWLTLTNGSARPAQAAPSGQPLARASNALAVDRTMEVRQLPYMDWNSDTGPSGCRTVTVPVARSATKARTRGANAHLQGGIPVDGTHESKHGEGRSRARPVESRTRSGEAGHEPSVGGSSSGDADAERTDPDPSAVRRNGPGSGRTCTSRTARCWRPGTARSGTSRR